MHASTDSSMGAAENLPHAPEDLTELADKSLAEFLMYLARYGGVVEERDGFVLFAGPHAQPNPYRNGVLRLDDSISAEMLLEESARFFAKRPRRYAVWVREHADQDLDRLVNERGYTALDPVPELWMDELSPELPLPDGVELRPATDAQTQQDYLQVVASAWGMGALPHALASQIFFDPESLNVPNVAAFVAYFDGLPLSGAMSFVTHGVALGCQAATVRRVPKGHRLPDPGPRNERRGLADGCLWEALKVSFERLGARGSVCQTSISGAPVWQRLGYRRFTSYGRYLAQP